MHRRPPRAACRWSSRSRGLNASPPGATLVLSVVEAQVAQRPAFACSVVEGSAATFNRRYIRSSAGRQNASVTKGPPTWAPSASSSRRRSIRSRELLGVVLGLVAQPAAGLEVPPGPGVGRDPVEHGVARCGRGQRGVDHPHAVVVGEPGGQVPDGLGVGKERADPAGDGVEAVAVGVQAEQGLCSDLRNAVERVRTRSDRRGERVATRGPSDGVVGRRRRSGRTSYSTIASSSAAEVTTCESARPGGSFAGHPGEVHHRLG